jgi:hypothetical protein
MSELRFRPEFTDYEAAIHNARNDPHSDLTCPVYGCANCDTWANDSGPAPTPAPTFPPAFRPQSPYEYADRLHTIFTAEYPVSTTDPCDIPPDGSIVGDRSLARWLLDDGEGVYSVTVQRLL